MPGDTYTPISDRRNETVLDNGTEFALHQGDERLRPVADITAEREARTEALEHSVEITRPEEVTPVQKAARELRNLRIVRDNERAA